MPVPISMPRKLRVVVDKELGEDKHVRGLARLIPDAHGRAVAAVDRSVFAPEDQVVVVR